MEKEPIFLNFKTDQPVGAEMGEQLRGEVAKLYPDRFVLVMINGEMDLVDVGGYICADCKSEFQSFQKTCPICGYKWLKSVTKEIKMDK